MSRNIKIDTNAIRLGAIPERLRAIQLAPNLKVAAARLKSLKKDVHETFKKLAFELHPDRHAGDKAKEEELKRLQGARDWIKNLRIEIRRMPTIAPAQVFWIGPPVFWGSRVGTYNGTTNGTTNGTSTVSQTTTWMPMIFWR